MAALVLPVRNSRGTMIVSESSSWIDFPGSNVKEFERTGARQVLLSNTGIWKGSITLVVPDRNDVAMMRELEALLSAMQVGGREVYVPIMEVHKQPRPGSRVPTLAVGTTTRVSSSEPHGFGIKVNFADCLPPVPFTDERGDERNVPAIETDFYLQIGDRVHQVHTVEVDERDCVTSVVVNPAEYPSDNDTVQGASYIVARQGDLNPIPTTVVQLGRRPWVFNWTESIPLPDVAPPTQTPYRVRGLPPRLIVTDDDAPALATEGARLLSISTDTAGATITPAYGAGVSSYTLSLTTGTEASLTATSTAGSRIYIGPDGPGTVDFSAAPSTATTLTSELNALTGENSQSIPILVRDEANQLDTWYQLRIANNAASDDASLSILRVRGGAGTSLAQSFLSTRTSYTGTVDASDGTVYVSAVPTELDATITITSGTISRAVRSGEETSFNVVGGRTGTITVAVTAPNGVATRTYTLTLTRGQAALLSDFTIQGFDTIFQYRADSIQTGQGYSLRLGIANFPRGTFGFRTRQVGPRTRINYNTLSTGADSAELNGSSLAPRTGRDLTVPEGLSTHTLVGKKSGLDDFTYRFMVMRYPQNPTVYQSDPPFQYSTLPVMTACTLSAGRFVDRNPGLRSGSRTFSWMISTPTAFEKDTPIFSVLLGAESSVTLNATVNSNVAAMTVDGNAQSLLASRATINLTIPPSGRRVLIQVSTRAGAARNYEFTFVRS